MKKTQALHQYLHDWIDFESSPGDTPDEKLHYLHLKLLCFVCFWGITLLILLETLIGHAIAHPTLFLPLIFLSIPYTLSRRENLSPLEPLVGLYLPLGTFLFLFFPQSSPQEAYFFQEPLSVLLLQFFWLYNTKRGPRTPTLQHRAFLGIQSFLIFINLLFFQPNTPIQQHHLLLIFSFLLLSLLLLRFFIHQSEGAKLKNLSEKNQTLEQQVIHAEDKFEKLSLNLENIYFYQVNYKPLKPKEFLFVSPTAERDLGFNLDILRSDPNVAHQKIHPEERSQFQAQETMSVSQKLPFEHIARMKFTDGHYQWMKFRSYPTVQADGSTTYSGIIQNIHEEYLFEKSIQESEQLLSHLTSHLPDAVLTLEHQTSQITHATGNYFDLLGYTIRELKELENFPLCIIKEEDQGEYIKTKNEIDLGNERQMSYELRIQIKGGGARWFNIRDTILSFNSNGKIFSRLLIFTDITALHNKTVSLQQSRQKLEKLSIEATERNIQLESYAHIASHNLRGPISNLLGLGQLYKENPNVPAADILDRAISTFENLNQIVIDLHQSLEVEKDKSYQKEWVAFKPLIESVISEVEQSQNTLFEFSTTIEIKTKQKLLVDPDLFKQVFGNLYSNALRFRSPERPLEVHIHASCNDRGWTVNVTDNGLGLDLNVQGRKLFGLYQTFHRGIESNGVGLFMTNALMKAIGGSISVKSKEGKGSTFTLFFPKIDDSF